MMIIHHCIYGQSSGKHGFKGGGGMSSCFSVALIYVQDDSISATCSEGKLINLVAELKKLKPSSIQMTWL